MGSKSINEEKNDRWVWKDSDTTEYTVKSAYSILKDEKKRKGVPMYEGFGG